MGANLKSDGNKFMRMRVEGVLAALGAVLLSAMMDGCVPSSETQTLTTLQRDAVLKAVSAAGDFANGLVASAPAFLGDALSGEGSCPQSTVSVTEDLRAAITLDYGDGCTPAFLPGKTVAGSAVATISAGSAFELDFVNLGVDGASLAGGISGSLVRDESNKFSVDVTADLTGSAGRITGTANLSGGLGGVVEIRAANLIVEPTDGGGVLSIVADDVAMELTAGGNPIPQSGLILIGLDPTSAPDDSTEIAVAFTTNSPTTRIVLVSVNSGPQIELTLP